MNFGVILIRRLHLWAGLLLSIQVLLWMASGVVMSWFHLDLVRGERNATPIAPPELSAAAYASPGGVIAQVDGAYAVELKHFLGRPVYVVTGIDGKALFNANDGAQLSPLDEDTVRRVARAGYLGDGEIEDLTLVDNPPQEYRGRRPVWRAQFNDKLHTRLYISKDTGDIVSRRNDIWRLYDFFWMLHIMDYEERTNYNNPLLKAASAAGLFFAVTGLIMLFFKSSWMALGRDIRGLSRFGARLIGRKRQQR